MPESLKIEEHRSSSWKYILSISLAVAILFLILFLVNNNPLIVGIFRLIAFIGFAGFVLALLQLQGKTKEIKIEIDDDQLIIKYFSSSIKDQEELFDIPTIGRIEEQPAPAIWKIIPRNDCSKLQISFSDTPNLLSMLRFQGRDLYVNHSDARKTIHYLEENLPSKVK